tara:strand:+ start:239 stop:361 length:123 start_codon:yes stop_codon:yes gene_type:complete
LDIGCGTGGLIHKIALKGASHAYGIKMEGANCLYKFVKIK